MKRKKLIEKLEDISSDMENYTADSSLLTQLKDFRAIQGRLDEVIGKLQDEEDKESVEDFPEEEKEKE